MSPQDFSAQAKEPAKRYTPVKHFSCCGAHMDMAYLYAYENDVDCRR